MAEGAGGRAGRHAGQETMTIGVNGKLKPGPGVNPSRANESSALFSGKAASQ
jgi:hypothetical protein